MGFIAFVVTQIGDGVRRGSVRKFVRSSGGFNVDLMDIYQHHTRAVDGSVSISFKLLSLIKGKQLVAV